MTALTSCSWSESIFLFCSIMMKLYSFSAEETVVIEGNALKLTTREDVEQYIKEIQSKPKLKMFVTSGNSYGAEAAVALAEALQVQGNLIVL